MQGSNQREDIEFRIRLCNGIFIGVILLTIVAVYIRPVLGPMKTPGSHSGLLFHAFLAVSILALPIARYVVWRGLRTAGKGILDSGSPVTRGGLVYTVGFISMWPLFVPAMDYQLANITLRQSLILAATGMLSYVNYLMLIRKIRESIGRE